MTRKCPKSDPKVTQKCPEMAVVMRNSRLLAGICARAAARQSGTDLERAAAMVPVALRKRGFEWRQTFHCSGVAPPPPPPPSPPPRMQLPEAKKMQLQYTCKVQQRCERSFFIN